MRGKRSLAINYNTVPTPGKTGSPHLKEHRDYCLRGVGGGVLGERWANRRWSTSYLPHRRTFYFSERSMEAIGPVREVLIQRQAGRHSPAADNPVSCRVKPFQGNWGNSTIEGFTIKEKGREGREGVGS